MTIPRDGSTLGLGLEFPISNNETASLLPSDQETTRYGSSVSNEPGTKCRVRTTRRDISQSEEERTSSKSMQELSSSLSALHSFTKSPVNRIWRNLTGGWCDEVSLRLQNSGSVARDHLALERTFLAYMRTSLAIASAGIGECPDAPAPGDSLTLCSLSSCTAIQYIDQGRRGEAREVCSSSRSLCDCNGSHCSFCRCVGQIITREGLLLIIFQRTCSLFHSTVCSGQGSIPGCEAQCYIPGSCSDSSRNRGLLDTCHWQIAILMHF